MTESEAINDLKMTKCTRFFIPSNESLDMAIQALEEIQQYRAIGTVKQFEWCKDASHWKELFKDKLEQYEAIGTVEEIKSYFNDNRKAGYKHGYSDGYAKAIDEFAEKLKETLNTYIEDAKDEGDYTYIKPFEISKRAVKEVAEQLKDGGENEY